MNVVPARRSGAVVSAMLHDPRVRKLSFTGSTEVGRILLKEAADQVVNCSMELGGNAPFLVFDDADLDAALDGAMVAKMRNGGEACTAANRFYVQRRRRRGVLPTGWRERMAAMRVGPGADRRHPGRSAGQPRGRRPRSTELVQGAVDAGAAGRRRRHAAPTAPGSTTSRPCSPTYRPAPPILREEIFGPVAPIVDLRPTRPRRSGSPTTPSSASSPTSTPATSPAACGSARRWSRAWSASTAASSPTPPRPSAAPSRAASAARAGTRGCWTTWRASTSPSTW